MSILLQILERSPFIAFLEVNSLQKPEFFENAITFARSKIPNIKFGMQTNGVLLNQNI